MTPHARIYGKFPKLEKWGGEAETLTPNQAAQLMAEHAEAARGLLDEVDKALESKKPWGLLMSLSHCKIKKYLETQS